MPLPPRSFRTKRVASCEPMGLQISWKSHHRKKSLSVGRVFPASVLGSGNHQARIGTRLASYFSESCFSSAPSGSQSAMMTGVEAWSMRVAQAVGTSRRYQVRGHALSPATVITFWPGATRAFARWTTSSERTRSLDV